MNTEGGTPLRVLIATSDGGLEARLLDGLPGEAIVVAARALDAATLLDRLEQHPGAIDAALVGSKLHGLRETTLMSLRERQMPVLLLAADDREARRYDGLAPAMLASAPVPAIAAALRRTHEGQPLTASPGRVEAPAPAVLSEASDRNEGTADGRVIAVTSGKGAPGKTTLAISLAAILGRAGYTVAVADGDLRGGNVAPYLGLDPRRGLVGLALAAGPLDARLAAELQDGPGCAVLAGVERPELAAALAPELLVGVIARLRVRYERVVVDLGCSPDAAALQAADQALFVAGADLVSLWNARLALRSLDIEGGGRWSLVVNRREGREHYDADEIGRALGVRVLGAVREDRKAARRAIERQAPLSAVGGRAAADLTAIAAALEDALSPATEPSGGGITTPVVVEASR